MRSTRLIAESLRVMSVPVAHDLPSATFVAAAALRDIHDAARQPERADAVAPGWLRPEQVDAWRRVIAAILGWNGAILAEPVGSGKSWIALATAAHFGQVPLVIGPAALESQWRKVGNRAGLPIRWHSHERLSRGVAPTAVGFVIIDEAHRFRHSGTRRVLTIAPWLAGRRTLMLTATPIVNRRADLLALLHLLAADDALILDGIPSLRALATSPAPPSALSRLVIRGTGTRATVPRTASTIMPGAEEEARGLFVVEALRKLTLSGEPAIRRLLTTVLLDAASSSHAAWRAALKRYRALLLQSRDGGGISRSVLRQFAGPALEQVVLWPLLGELDLTSPPPADDLPVVEELLAAPVPHEGWMDAVGGIIADLRPTICFTRHRATAAALIRHLGDDVAWVTGDAAGIGCHGMDRASVLAAFGPGREHWRLLRRRPTCLVCTEVLAEGLDLHGANRVIHLDLPWHPSRLEQRNGRVQRIGQLATEVSVVTRHPVAAIEAALGINHAIQHKVGLSGRWMQALSVDDRDIGIFMPGAWYAVASGSPHEAIARVILRSGQRLGTIGLVLQDATWHHVPVKWPDHVVGFPADQVTRFERGQCGRLARRAIWKALEVSRAPIASRPQLVARLLTQARLARTARDLRSIDRLDALLGVANQQVPLGLELLLHELGTAPDISLKQAVLPVPHPLPRPVPVGVLLILFRSAGSPLR